CGGRRKCDGADRGRHGASARAPGEHASGSFMLSTPTVNMMAKFLENFTIFSTRVRPTSVHHDKRP
ncbi:hypothetical protein, partial [Mycolicibacterium fortuitum]|uniref:hypothetical protein n=1 Tax=Mycolicibacterium fortuitum TaxID=1766 RepID=UPI001B7F7B4E